MLEAKFIWNEADMTESIGIKGMMDEVTSKVSQKMDEILNKIIKQLVSHTGIDVESISPENVIQIKEEMLNKGYEIVAHSPTPYITCYNLIYKGNTISTCQVEQEVVFEDGNATMKITYKNI